MRGHLYGLILRGVCVLLLTSPYFSSVAWAAEETEESEAITLPEVTVKGKPMGGYGRESRTEVTADVAALPAPSTILDAQHVRYAPRVSRLEAVRRESTEGGWPNAVRAWAGGVVAGHGPVCG